MSHTWPAELVQQVIDRNTKLIEFIERRDGQESDCYLTIHIPIEEAVILRDEARAAGEMRAKADRAMNLLRRIAGQSRGIAAHDTGLVQVTVIAEPILKEIESTMKDYP